MEIQYVYQKKRSEFGRQCLFSDKGPDLIDNFPSNRKLVKDYVLRDPVNRHQQCVPVQAEHYINTQRAEFVTGYMNHVEGGWPKDVNTADEEQTKRYRRKVEKDENFNHVMMQLFKNMENCILQNNAINIYEQYFSDVEALPIVEKSSARTVNAFHDQCYPQRPVTHISWSPDGQNKLAVSHCNLTFQAVVPNESKYSFIWEIENPNKPLFILKPETAIVCLEYNQKDPHSLVSGMFNGQVALWDTRKGPEPVELSLIENSFRDPVHNVLWIHSKTGNEFFSSSTDGQVKWWDVRKLSEPTDVLIIDHVKEEDQSMANAVGASVLEYEPTIPTRFMIGCENGTVFSCNRKGKTALEKLVFKYQAHLGPVLALQRNPGFVKNFLTVGDWRAKIWSEDCKESSIKWTNFHKALLTDGAWSPSRLSVFFTTRSDGVLDVWDILQQQKQACLSTKVCDDVLKCLRTHESGRIVAVGNQKGSTYLVELSENLATLNKNDKVLLAAMFERESKREKILEARSRELRLKHKTQNKPSGAQLAEESGAEGAGETEEQAEEAVFSDNFVLQAERDFYATIEKETVTEEVEPEELPLDEEVLEVSEEVEPPPPSPPLSDQKVIVKKKGGKKKK